MGLRQESLGSDLPDFHYVLHVRLWRVTLLNHVHGPLHNRAHPRHGLHEPAVRAIQAQGHQPYAAQTALFHNPIRPPLPCPLQILSDGCYPCDNQRLGWNYF